MFSISIQHSFSETFLDAFSTDFVAKMLSKRPPSWHQHLQKSDFYGNCPVEVFFIGFGVLLTAYGSPLAIPGHHFELVCQLLLSLFVVIVIVCLVVCCYWFLLFVLLCVCWVLLLVLLFSLFELCGNELFVSDCVCFNLRLHLDS